MMKREWVWFGSIGFIFLSAFIFSPFSAAGQYVVINVEVSGSDTYTETFVTNIDWNDVYANPDSRKGWSLKLDGGYPNGYLIDLGDHNALIEDITIGIKADPKVELGFSAISTDGATNFLFTTDVLTFAPLTSASAYVYAEAGSLPGTTVSALSYDPKLFRALYNGTEIFADAVNGYSFVPGGVWDYYTGSISGQVSSIQAKWNFKVSSGGHAHGIGIFEVSGETIPEPATIALLGFGGLALLRKHRA